MHLREEVAARKKAYALATWSNVGCRSTDRFQERDYCESEVIEQLADGRTDLVSEYLAEGHAARSVDTDGVSLIRWCAYYGDVSTIKFLLANGESLSALGDNYGLNAACFHGHWRLCQFLI